MGQTVLYQRIVGKHSIREHIREVQKRPRLQGCSSTAHGVLIVLAARFHLHPGPEDVTVRDYKISQYVLFEVSFEVCCSRRGAQDSFRVLWRQECPV